MGGSQAPRSIIANAQRCVNLYPEVNAKDAPVPFTYYQRPGLVPRAQGGPSPVRGLYSASNGHNYVVIGQVVYTVDANWVLTQIGALITQLQTPVSMIDNGSTLFLVDNSLQGYNINIATDTLSQIVDPSGIFAGGTKVDYIDTFMLWNLPASRNFGSTLSNVPTFDATYIAGKAGYPDPLVTLIVNRREIILFGQKKSEIWYDAGNANFPFAELPGSYIEHGCFAPFSVASEDINVYWLGQDLQGQFIIFRLRGYECKRISSHTVEFAMKQMKAAGADLSDAIAFTYQFLGHVFYQINFKSGNQTWIYDASIADPELAWHQEAWTDAQGVLNRHRGNCSAYMNGEIAVGDWNNGTIYTIDTNTYTDTLAPAGASGPCSYIRGFPHVLAGVENGQPVMLDGKSVRIDAFVADMEVGNAPLDPDGTPAKVWLRWSTDRGKTFGNAVMQPNGIPGQYQTQERWTGLGYGRDMVLELAWSIPAPAALNGAWIDVTVLKS